MNRIEKLLSISSAPLSQGCDGINFDELGDYGPLGQQLDGLLHQRNGFYAFESALHVFPFARHQKDEKEIGLGRWNSFELWRFEYGDLADRVLFFAEDAFGNQFCLHDRRVRSFDAETGAMSDVADDIEGWAKQILTEYNVLTGYPLLHQWQQKNGALAAGSRLMPKIPFVLGGKYSLDNLYALAAVSAMKTRGNLARQIKDLPDGSRVEFRVIE
jgi:hypothetical protein